MTSDSPTNTEIPMLNSHFKLISLTLIAALSTACSGGSLTSDEFAKEYAAAYCEKSFECFPEEMIEDGVANVQECKDQFTPAFQASVNDEINGNGCSFDGAQASTCVNALQSFACNEDSNTIDDACGPVFSNCEGGDDDEDQFNCLDDGTPIPFSWVCDGEADCSDGSDEANCGG